jgi:hypothetical protein
MLSTDRRRLLSDVLMAVPSFSPPCILLLLLLSGIENILYVASPRTHPPSSLCLVHLLPPTAPRRCALSHTNQDPYHNCGTLTGVTSNQSHKTVLPNLPFSFVNLEREALPPHCEQQTHQLNQLNQSTTNRPSPTGIRTHLSHRTR